MRSVSLRLSDLGKAVIPIGIVGENLHTLVKIDCTKAFEEYPSAIAQMAVIPPRGETYPATLSRDGNTIIWEVTNSDLLYEGSGEIQLQFVVDETVAESFVGRTRVIRSIIANGEIPTAWENWLNDFTELKLAAEAAEAGAESSASDSEAYAVGKRGGVDVDSDDPTYHNNSKYYRDLAASEASGQIQSITDEGTRQIGLVQGEGTTQTGLVSAEGTRQIGLVEAKGDETIASIPSDYTTLSNDVSDLKSAIQAIEDLDPVSSKAAPSFTFSVSGTGIKSNTISCKAGDTITFNRTDEATGKLYGTATFHTVINGTDTYENFVNPGTKTLANDCNVYIQCSKVSASTVTLEELCELAAPCFGGSVTVESYYDIVSAVKTLQTEVDGKQDTLTFDDSPTQNSTNPVKSGGVYSEIKTLRDDVEELDGVPDKVDAIADLKDVVVEIDASTLTWGVNQAGDAVETEPVSVKSGSSVTYSRTEAATGNLYSPVSIYYTINGVTTYTSFANGSTHTFSDDCIMWIHGTKVSTSTKTYQELAELAEDCFTGTLKTVQSIDIVDTVKALQTQMGEVDGKIENAVAPALGGEVTVSPEWTDGYYYNSSLTPASNSACKIAKIDVSLYINSSMALTTYAMNSAYCGFTDADDSIISTWHQNSAETKIIPVNAKYLYLTNVPANLSPAVFSCVITAKNAAKEVAYLDVATGLKKYDSSKSYRIGDLRVNAGKLLHCIDDTTGTYDSNDWQETTLIDEFGLRDYIHPIIKLNGLTWNARGDSITAGSNGPSYVPIVSALLGFDSYVNSGVGGAYYAGAFTGASTNNDVTTVLAGTNDFGLTQGANTLTAFETAIRNSISSFKTNNPGKRLYLITPIPRFDKTENELELTLPDYVAKMEEVCSDLNVPCLNLYERCGITGNNYATYLKVAQGDSVHPNGYGAMRIAVEIAKFISEMEAIHRVVAFR